MPDAIGTNRNSLGVSMSVLGERNTDDTLENEDQILVSSRSGNETENPDAPSASG